MSTTALREAATGQRANSPTATVNNFLMQHIGQIEKAKPKHLSAERFVRQAMTAVSQNRTLAQCDPRSIFASTVIAAQMGLEIGVAGQGYLVPYKGKCSFIPGWQGLVDLVSRSGRGTVWTGAVFEGDQFDFALGDSPYVKHRPCGEDNPDKITHVYAIGRVNGAEWPIIEIWPIRRVRSHRDKFNKVGAQHYSFDHWEMYARKVPLLQVLKYMPKSIELTNAISISEAMDRGADISLDGEYVQIDEETAPQPEQRAEEPSKAETKAARREPPPREAPPPRAADNGFSMD